MGGVRLSSRCTRQNDMQQIFKAQPYISVGIWEVPRLKSWKQIAVQS